MMAQAQMADYPHPIAGAEKGRRVVYVRRTPAEQEVPIIVPPAREAALPGQKAGDPWLFSPAMAAAAAEFRSVGAFYTVVFDPDQARPDMMFRDGAEVTDEEEAERLQSVPFAGVQEVAA
jgi:hypothetical protein